MNSFFPVFVQGFLKLIIPVGILLGSLVFGFILRSMIFHRLRQWVQNTKTQMDDIIVSSVRKPFIIWCLMGGIYIVLRISELSPSVEQMAEKFLFILGVISVSMVVGDVMTKLITSHARSIEAAMPVTSLTQSVVYIIIFIIGLLTILHTLGVSITPVLASLGVGGLAVALALQDTLSNFFSGFHIIVSKQVKIGDYVKLGSGEEGYVTDINWRTTQIRALPNNVILVPNAKLTQAIIINYCLPQKEMAVLVDLGVHYDSDLRKVEKVTCAVAKEIMREVPGGMEGFEPFIRYHTFADSSINFTVILRAKEFVDQYLIKHEFICKLHERYKKEGIVIPYPIRAINYQQENKQAAKLP